MSYVIEIHGTNSSTAYASVGAIRFESGGSPHYNLGKGGIVHFSRNRSVDERGSENFEEARFESKDDALHVASACHWNNQTYHVRRRMREPNIKANELNFDELNSCQEYYGR